MSMCPLKIVVLTDVFDFAVGTDQRKVSLDCGVCEQRDQDPVITLPVTEE
jgi:hypothetical protein